MLSLYIHYPFCLSKCPYCDFNSYKISEINDEEYLKAYCKELEYYYNLTKNRKIDTIFFGGGTPSIMNINFLESILKKIDNLWGIDNSIEISMEANPTTVEINKFQEFKNVGINRISIGIQSLNDTELKFFGRIHNREEGIKAINIAQKVFKDKYSIDLIYARPNQKLSNWIEELKEAVKLSPFHISLYQLIIEEGTVFFEKKIKKLNDNKAIIFYNETNKFLENNGLHLYEVSNYSQCNYECKHNINYWNSGEWIGVGAGAHGRICLKQEFNNNYKERIVIENIKLPQKWLQHVLELGYGYEIFETLTKEEFVEEVIIMGLRQKNGVNISYLRNYLNIDNIYDIVNKNNIKFLTNNKYIKINKNNIKININCFNILDSIIERLLP